MPKKLKLFPNVLRRRLGKAKYEERYIIKTLDGIYKVVTVDRPPQNEQEKTESIIYRGRKLFIQPLEENVLPATPYPRISSPYPYPRLKKPLTKPKTK